MDNYLILNILKRIDKLNKLKNIFSSITQKKYSRMID